MGRVGGVELCLGGIGGGRWHRLGAEGPGEGQMRRGTRGEGVPGVGSGRRGEGVLGGVQGDEGELQ